MACKATGDHWDISSYDVAQNFYIYWEPSSTSVGWYKIFKASKTLPTCMKCLSASASVPVHRTGHLSKDSSRKFCTVQNFMWFCVENFTFEKALSCLHTGDIVWKWALLRMLDGRVIATSSDGTLSLSLSSLAPNGPLCVSANLHVCDSLGKLSKNVPCNMQFHTEFFSRVELHEIFLSDRKHPQTFWSKLPWRCNNTERYVAHGI